MRILAVGTQQRAPSYNCWTGCSPIDGKQVREQPTQQPHPFSRALVFVVAALTAATVTADDRLPAHSIMPTLAPRIALIIDDLGYNLELGRRALALPGPITAAVLPFTPHTVALAQLAAGAGIDVILHEPMQAADETVCAPGTLSTVMSDADLRGQLAHALAQVPQAIGVNNHTGSLLTAQRAPMISLMAELHAQGLFFLDSRTTPDTVARDVAVERGVPSARRDVFLDHVVEVHNIAAEFERAISIARRQGHAVLIAHPYQLSLTFLEQALPTLAARGIVLIKLASLLEPVSAPATPELRADRASLRTTPAL